MTEEPSLPVAQPLPSPPARTSSSRLRKVLFYAAGSTLVLLVILPVLLFTGRDVKGKKEVVSESVKKTLPYTR